MWSGRAVAAILPATPLDDGLVPIDGGDPEGRSVTTKWFERVKSEVRH